MRATIWLCWFILCGVPAAADSAEQRSPAESAGATAAPSASEAVEESSIDMNFQDVDIRDFIKYVSDITATNVIIDSGVKGRITIEASTPVPIKEVFRFFQSVLEVYGYATVQAGEMVKIVPSAMAPRKSIETGIAEDVQTSEDKLVTRMIRLNYLSPDEAKRLLTPLASKSGVIVSHPSSATLIITDFHPNVERLHTVISSLDAPTVRRNIPAHGEPIVVKVIALDHADAETLASVLRPLLTKDGRITAYPPTNTLIIKDKKSIVDQLVKAIKGEVAP